jgi:hypothetical protein
MKKKPETKQKTAAAPSGKTAEKPAGGAKKGGKK